MINCNFYQKIKKENTRFLKFYQGQKKKQSGPHTQRLERHPCVLLKSVERESDDVKVDAKDPSANEVAPSLCSLVFGSKSQPS